MATCGHDCRCMEALEEGGARAVAVRATVPTVTPALTRRFGAAGEDDVVVVPAERIAELGAFLDGLSGLERASMRATVVRPDGTFDPWTAGPAEQVLRRVETPWFPGLMAARALRFEFQPIVDPEAGVVHGNEALVRSALPDRTLSPADLIEAARAHDALLQFDQMCRTAAITQGAPAMLGGGEGRLFVNFMPLTIYDPVVCLRTTFAAADAVGIPVTRLVFEVVESEQFPHIDHLRAILEAYREQGAGVALDDVGSGNTAIRYIDELEPDYVKLDRELLRRAVETGEGSMYEGLVGHCRALGIRVIAEGLETAEELAYCRELGVDLVQGYLVGRPAAEPRTERVELGGGNAPGAASEDGGAPLRRRAA